jgi:hypothetical protein
MRRQRIRPIALSIFQHFGFDRFDWIRFQAAYQQ